MAVGNSYKLKYEVMHILLELDAGSLQCAHGIIELNVSESKKGNQHLLFRNLVRHLYSEEVDAREDDGFHLFQKLHKFLSKHSKTPKNGTLKPSVNKQVLLIDIKQTLNNEFIHGTIEHQTKTEKYAHHPQNSNKIFCLQKLKDFKISDDIGESGEKGTLFYTSLTYQIQNGRKDGYMLRNLSSVNSYMLLFLLVYEIITFVMISTTCSKM